MTASLERLLRATDVAELLGFSPMTILDWYEQGRLPGLKVGRAVRFRESEIAAWLDERERVARRGPVTVTAAGILEARADGRESRGTARDGCAPDGGGSSNLPTVRGSA